MSYGAQRGPERSGSPLRYDTQIPAKQIMPSLRDDLFGNHFVNVSLEVPNWHLKLLLLCLFFKVANCGLKITHFNPEYRVDPV